MILPPEDITDKIGAERVFRDFYALYEQPLTKVEHYLAKLMADNAHYADAYQPWLIALKDMMQGVYLVTKRIPLPDTSEFFDAVRMFSFRGAIEFLSDLCENCLLHLQRDWVENFHRHIHMLLSAASILFQQRQQGLSR